MNTASKAPAFFSASTSLNLMVGDDADAHGLDAADFAHQILARQPIGWNAEMHHASRQWARLADLDRVAQSRQVIGGRQPAWPGTDHKDALASLLPPRP